MKKIVFSFLFILINLLTAAQVLKNYSFEQSSTMYETIIYFFDDTLFDSSVDDMDDGEAYLDLSGWFSFKYCGNEYDKFIISTNGFLGFGDIATTQTYNNKLKGYNYPIAAPVWDDLVVKDNVYFSVDYDYNHPGKQILTIEWSGLYYDNELDTFSVQVKLYEATGVIEFIYYDMFYAYFQSDMSASIGINYYNQDIDSLEIISITPNSAGATFSRVVSNDTISEDSLSNIDDGTVYRFTPIPRNLKLNRITNPICGDLDYDSIMVTVEVKNVGFDTTNKFYVHLWIIDTVSKKILLDTIKKFQDTLYPDSIYTCPIVNFKFDSDTIYQISAKVIDSSDAYPNNDSIGRIYYFTYITTPPYHTDFSNENEWQFQNTGILSNQILFETLHDNPAIARTLGFKVQDTVRVTYQWEEDASKKTAKRAGHDTLFFEYSTNLGNTWHTIDTLVSNTDIIEYVGHLLVLNNDTIIFRFRDYTDKSSSASYTYILDFDVSESPYNLSVKEITEPANVPFNSGQEPSTFTPTNNTRIKARLVNYSVENVNSFNVKTVVIDTNTKTVVYSNTNPYDFTFNALTDTIMYVDSFPANYNKVYWITVKTIYSKDDEEADDSLTVIVKTDTLVDQFPQTEDFEDQDPPKGWDDYNTSYTEFYYYSGSRSQRIPYYTSYSEAYLITPAIKIAPTTTVSFWLKGLTSSTDDTLFIQYTSDFEQTWINLDTFVNVANSDFNKYSYDFDSYDTIKVRFYYKASGYGDNIFYIDLFSITQTLTSSQNLHSPLIYPNPTSNFIKVLTPAKEVIILNTLGEKIMEIKQPGYIINITDLKPGVYLIKLTDSNNKIYVEKLIKY